MPQINRLLFVLWVCRGLCLCGCLTNPLRPNIITNLRFSPDVFDSYKGNTSLKFTLQEEARVSIWMSSASGQRVKHLVDNVVETKGTHSHGWLGLNDDGYFVPAGVYLATVTADSDEAQTSVELFHF